MKVVESSIIEHPAAEVFEAASDPETQLKWDPQTLRSVTKLTPGPLGEGTRYRSDFKGFGVIEYEFVEYQPPRRFTHHTVVKLGEMRHTFTFETVPAGTRLTQELLLTPNLLGRLMQPMMARMLPKRFKTIASELDQYLAAVHSSRSQSDTLLVGER